MNISTLYPLDYCDGRTILRRVCSLFPLFVVIAAFLSFGQPETAHADSTGLAYVAAATGLDADCDGGHAAHCCAGVACAGYAQHDAMTLSIPANDQHLLMIVQSDCVGQTLRPTPQPPRA